MQLNIHWKESKNQFGDRKQKEVFTCWKLSTIMKYVLSFCKTKLFYTLVS